MSQETLTGGAGCQESSFGALLRVDHHERRAGVDRYRGRPIRLGPVSRLETMLRGHFNATPLVHRGMLDEGDQRRLAMKRPVRTR